MLGQNGFRSLALLLLVAGLGGAIGSYSMFPVAEKHLAQVEIIRFFLFVCVVGGVSFLYQQYSDDEKREKDLVDERREFRGNVLRASHGIRSVRRRLRVLSTPAENGIKTFDLDRWIDEFNSLNGFHLEIENLRRVLSSSPHVSAGFEKDLSESLKGIDDYIRVALREVEFCVFDPSKGEISGDVERVSDFFFSSSPPSYIDDFVTIENIMLKIV